MGGRGMSIMHMIASGIGFVIAVAITIALVVLIVKLLKGWRPAGYRGWVPQAAAAGAAPVAEDPTDSAMKILSERLAQGDIDVDDYYARRTALKGPDPHRPEPTAQEPTVDI
jgi:uncharacterized membrane protein